MVSTHYKKIFDHKEMTAITYSDFFMWHYTSTGLCYSHLSVCLQVKAAGQKFPTHTLWAVWGTQQPIS